MAQIEQIEKRCTRHGTPTNLTCARCERPACGKCLVWTEVGQKCKECVYPRFSRERMPWLVPAMVAGAVLVAGALVAVLSLSGGGDGKAAAGPTGTEPRKQAAIGEKTADGGITFVVEGFDCQGKSLAEDPSQRLKALGRYCLLRLTATNTSSEPLTFSSFGRQGPVLVDDQRRRYVPDQRATAVVEPEVAEERRDAPALQLNPGSEVKRVLVFDIAEGVTPVTAELHASRGPGVEVRLST